MGSLGLYAMQFADIEKAKATLFEAFRSDPLFEYMLGNKLKEKRIGESIHFFTLTLGLKYGKVYSPSDQIEGVAIWFPPGHTNITIWKTLMSGVLQLQRTASDNFNEFISYAKKMIAFTEYSDTFHRKHASIPHWYLMVIGIGDQYRGKGYATKLLKPMLEKFDNDNTPCYLETQNGNNIELYKHFGFIVKEEGTVPGTEVKHWAMLRNPRIEK